MLYYGEHQHISIVLLTIVFIPVIVILSKSIYHHYLEIIQNNDKLHKSSITDSLTNTYNRHYFFETGNKMLSIASRDKYIVSFLMLDIDFFLKINDNYGHQE